MRPCTVEEERGASLPLLPLGAASPPVCAEENAGLGLFFTVTSAGTVGGHATLSVGVVDVVRWR